MDMDYFWGKYKIPVIVGGIILILAIGLGVYFGFFYEPPAPPEPEPDIVTDISVELMGEEKYKERVLELLSSPYCTIEANIYKGTADKRDVVPYISITAAQTSSQARIDMNLPHTPFQNFSNFIDVKAKKAYLYYSFPKETGDYFTEYYKEELETRCNALFTGISQSPQAFYDAGYLSLSEYTALAALNGVILETDLSNKNYISNQEMLAKTSNPMSMDVDVEDAINSLSFNAKDKTISGKVYDSYDTEYDFLAKFSQGKITSIEISNIVQLNDDSSYYLVETITPLDKDANLSSDAFVKTDKTVITLTEKEFSSALARSYMENTLSLMWAGSPDDDAFFAIDMDDLYYDFSEWTVAEAEEVDPETEETTEPAEGSEETSEEGEAEEEDGLVDIMLDIYNALDADEKKELIEFTADAVSTDDMKSLISSFFGDN